MSAAVQTSLWASDEDVLEALDLSVDDLRRRYGNAAVRVRVKKRQAPLFGRLPLSRRKMKCQPSGRTPASTAFISIEAISARLIVRFACSSRLPLPIATPLSTPFLTAHAIV